MSVKDETREEDIGSMCIVLHRERSFHNIDVRTLKSAIQKYARRAMFYPKGVWCLIELDLFSILETNPHAYSNVNEKKLTEKQIQINAKKIRSNSVNRLVAMMSEDVGPTDPTLPLKVYELYSKWIENRGRTSGREYLLKLYYLLSNDKVERIRLLSDLRTVYNLPERLTENKNLHRKLLEKFGMNDLLEILYGKSTRGKTKEELCRLIIEHLSNKSELAFAFLSLLFERKGDDVVRDRLWPFVIKRNPFPKSAEALFFFYKKLKHKEHKLYLFHAMSFFVFEETIRKVASTESKAEFNGNVDRLYEEHRDESRRIEIDGFVFDLHTGNRTSREHFATEGALVENQCRSLLNENYRQMYIEFKVMIDEDERIRKENSSKSRKRPADETGERSSTNKIPKTEENFVRRIEQLNYRIEIEAKSFVDDFLSGLSRAQRRTGNHKKSVFVSTDFVFKGPYRLSDKKDEQKFFNNLYGTRALLAMEEELKVDDALRSVVDWTSFVRVDGTDDFYLKQKSIGDLSSSLDEFDLVTTKIETNVKILRRGSHVNRLIELEDELEHSIEKSSPIFRGAVQHFYLRFLLNIGDSGTWNVLVRRDETQRICAIDFEEFRSDKVKRVEDPIDLIFSKISRKQKEIYGRFIDQIRIFDKKIDRSTPLALLLSSSLKFDLDKINERLEKFVSLLEKKKN